MSQFTTASLSQPPSNPLGMMASAAGGALEGEFWCLRGPPVCRVRRCVYPGSTPSAAGGGDDGSAAAAAPAPVVALPSSSLPADFTSQPRLIMWYQDGCAACRGAKLLFDALAVAAAAEGYSVHRVEATRELLERFPHVRVVPLFDLVQPGEATTTSPSSVYGPGTRLRTVRNDLQELRLLFPQLETELVRQRQQQQATLALPHA